MALLVSKNVTKRFGGLEALKDVNLEVREQGIQSIIGPNGAGKTTFFNCVTGFYTPEVGEILLDGRNITGLSPDRVSKLGIARTYQNIRLFKNMTAVENILVGMHALMKSGIIGATLRDPRTRKRGSRRHWKKPGACCVSWAWAARATRWPRTCLTATSAVWRSLVPWPANRSCCSWMTYRWHEPQRDPGDDEPDPPAARRAGASRFCSSSTRCVWSWASPS